MKKVGGTAAVIVLFILLNGTQILSQGRKMDGTIKGIVHESNSDQPVVYANVSLRNIKDSSVVTGDMTDDAGAFEITKVPAGRYYIDIKFLGFATKSLDSIMMFPQRPVLDLGTIYLDPQSYQSEGVEVTAEKEKIEYKLDRKIINITNDVLNAGGSAAEALERTPSVNVDLEGNVSLRGSTEFTVLINGKPSALEGSDALQQIPVSSIEHIEILTNPSAKYDPEGLAGIINVILKEPVLKGFNGMTSLSAGVNDKYDFDINMNFGFNKLNLSAGVNYSKNRYLSEGQMEKTITNENSTIFQSSEELGHRDRNSFNFKLGADYSFARNFSTNFEIGYGGMDFEHKSTGDEITDISDESPIYGISTMIGGRDNNFYNFN